MHLDLRAMAGMLIKESDALYMSRLDGNRLPAYEPSKDVERGAISTGWAWDARSFDFDCDGDDDLYLVNGTNDYQAYAAIYNYVDWVDQKLARKAIGIERYREHLDFLTH